MGGGLCWHCSPSPMKDACVLLEVYLHSSCHERAVLTAEAAVAEARAGTGQADLAVEQVEARFGPANSSMTAAIKKCLASGGLHSGTAGPV